MTNLFGEAEAEPAADGHDDDFSVGDYADVIDAQDNSGLQLPRHSTYCAGHEAIEQRLIQLIKDDKLPHALIFSGIEGIGKSTLAYRLARYLLAHGKVGNTADDGNGLFDENLPEAADEASDTLHDTLHVAPEERVFQQVASGGHPDLLTIERPFDAKKGRFKGHIDVEEARRVTPFMRMTASQGGWRVVIVDDADKMNRNAQNAILKILEEPPENAILVLVCHRLGAMIPTIRSRCRVVQFQPLAFDLYRTVLRKDHPDMTSDDIDVLHSMTGGSIGQALRIAEEEGLEAVNNITDIFQSWPQWDWVKIHAFSDNMGRAGSAEAYEMFQRLMIWIVDTLTRHKAYNAPLPMQLKTEAVGRMIAHYSLNDWIEIARSMVEHFETFDKANLDKRQAVFGSFSLLKE